MARLLMKSVVHHDRHGVEFPEESEKVVGKASEFR